MNSYKSQFPINIPPVDFVHWFEPYKTDSESGASVGGHPEARRIWGRKDEGKWTQRTYGMPTRTAWADASIREEYDAWKAVGSPVRLKDFKSIATTVERQEEFWSELKTNITRIDTKMPKPQPMDYEANNVPDL